MAYRKTPQDIKYDCGETDACELKCLHGKSNYDCFIREDQCLFHGRDTSNETIAAITFTFLIFFILLSIFIAKGQA